jgi:hypothetical protein
MFIALSAVDPDGKIRMGYSENTKTKGKYLEKNFSVL